MMRKQQWRARSLGQARAPPSTACGPFAKDSVVQKQAGEPGPRPARHVAWQWPLAAALVLAGAIAAGLYLGAAGNRAREAMRQGAAVTAPPVHVAMVEKRDVPVFIDGLGTAQATNAVSVKSRVDGQITKIGFEEGQIVREGDLLVQIDAAPYQAALDQATAKLAQDQASLTNARQDLVRTSSLAKAGDATQQLLDQRTAAVAQFSAQIQADNAAIESAKVQLAYTTIRAPLTGRAGFRLVDSGNIVHANDQAGILSITQITPISVIFTAPEGELPAISTGLHSGPLAVTALSSDGKRTLAEGTLSLIDNQVDTASGTIRLKASFPNAEQALWPGQSVTTRLRVSTIRDAVAVPDTAVQRGPNGLFAFVVGKDGAAELRDTKVGPIQDGWVVIESGLVPGERVITSGHYRVQPGKPIQVVSNDGTAAGDNPSGAP